MMSGNLATRCPTVPAAADVRSDRSARRCAAAFVADVGLTTTLRFRIKDTIFSDSDDANYFYVLVEGGVRLCKVRSNGRRQIVRLVLPGDLFGVEIGTKHKLTAEALSDVTVRRYPRKSIERLDDAMSETQRMVMALLYRERATVQQHLVMIGRHSAKERVASFLLLLQERTEIRAREKLDLPIGREDFADYLGLTVETVSRALSELRRTGLIRFLKNPRQLAILDLDALQTAANGRDI